MGWEKEQKRLEALIAKKLEITLEEWLANAARRRCLFVLPRLFRREGFLTLTENINHFLSKFNLSIQEETNIRNYDSLQTDHICQCSKELGMMER